MALPHLEPTSAAAASLRAHLCARLSDAATALKVLGCAKRHADVQRGRIAELEDLLEAVAADAARPEQHPHAIVP